MSTASDKQIAFIDSLLDTRIVEDRWVAKIDAYKASDTLTKDVASKIITALKDLDAKKLVPHPANDVPSGRYAITTDDVTKFYKVDVVTEGKWAGRTFVKVLASDMEYPVKSPVVRAQVLNAIAVDPAAASLLYGREIGSCGVCGRTLTDEQSRERGIGPVCSEKTGW